MADAVSPGTPVPPAPAGGPSPFRSAFVVREVKNRWPFSLRVAFCAATTITVGWLADDIQAGLLATLGVFTASYGQGRPYLNRATLQCGVALSIASSAALGVWASAQVWSAVLMVTVIATVATFVCSAIRVEAPGAYMFVLVCASGAAMAEADVSPLRVGLLALAGGALSVVVQSSGVLISPRGPEKDAVAAAGLAVADFAEARASEREVAARQAAAQALSRAWAVLVTYQPVRPKPNSTLHRLRSIGRAEHVLFAEAMQGVGDSAELASRARTLAAAAHHPSEFEPAEPDGASTPVGRAPTWALLRAALTPGSRTVRLGVRVGIAAAASGLAASMLGIDHIYWAMAAAVLMLHGDLDWPRTVQKSFQRLIGTWAGLLIAGVILAVHPQGLWLALVLAVLKFCLQMFMVRNYALAVVFITPSAMTAAFADERVDDIPLLLLDRGLDTAVGCAVALAVFALTARHMESGRVSDAVARALDAVGPVVRQLATGVVTTPAARAVRLDLHSSAMALLPTFETSLGGAPKRRVAAEELWPALVATERLGYQALAACWTVERDGSGPPLDEAAADDLAGVVTDLAQAVRTRAEPGPVDAPKFLAAEVLAVRDSLVWTTRASA